MRTICLTRTAPTLASIRTDLTSPAVVICPLEARERGTVMGRPQRIILLMSDRIRHLLRQMLTVTASADTLLTTTDQMATNTSRAATAHSLAVVSGGEVVVVDAEVTRMDTNTPMDTCLRSQLRRSRLGPALQLRSIPRTRASLHQDKANMDVVIAARNR